MNKLLISPPWVEYQNKVRKLFERDREVKIDTVSGSANAEVKLYVSNPAKAAALARMLPLCKEFGGVKCAVTVVPSNGNLAMPKSPEGGVELAVAAFEGNDAVAAVRQVSKGLFKDIAYVAFKREVVQFPNDQLDDINGNWSGLYADIAKEVCEKAEGIFFCTAAEANANGAPLAAPLGEWP